MLSLALNQSQLLAEQRRAQRRARAAAGEPIKVMWAKPCRTPRRWICLDLGSQIDPIMHCSLVSRADSAW
jgi:hypothetical protein